MEQISGAGIDFGALPKHIAVRLGKFTKEEKTRLDFFTQRDQKLKASIKLLVSLKIPVQTYYLSSLTPSETTDAHFLEDFFTELASWDFIHDNQIKVGLIGKWYKYPERVIEPLKEVLEVTKDYDKFFVNFCLNYDGKEELVAAAKLIGYQVKAGKLDPDKINESVIKENIYNSYFMPPDLMMVYGHSCSTGGLMLWDSSNTSLRFMNKPFIEWEKEDVYKVLKQGKLYK